MSLERAMSRGRFLKARFGVNGSQNAARSLGTSARTAGLGLAAVVIRARSFGTGVSWRRTMPAGPALVQLSLVCQSNGLGRGKSEASLTTREASRMHVRVAGWATTKTLAGEASGSRIRRAGCTQAPDIRVGRSFDERSNARSLRRGRRLRWGSDRAYPSTQSAGTVHHWRAARHDRRGLRAAHASAGARP